MKRHAMILVFVIFAAIMLPCLSVSGEPAYPPHEDPASAKSTMDAYSFLTQYGDILNLVSLKEYENATKLIEQLKNAYVPADLKFVMDRYNNLTQELIGVLGNLDTLLNEASGLLSQYRLAEASQVLQDAGILVSKANILLGDLEQATGTLSQQIGVFAAPAESNIRQAYDRLQSIFQRLRELAQEYNNLLTSINSQAQKIQQEELKPTELTLSLNTTNLFVGEYLYASGKLNSDGQNLANRTVTLFLDEGQAATAITGSDGSYHALIKIPYNYVHHTMTTKALYTPIGNDTGVYLASLSPLITVNVIFYETKLETTVPDEAHPGLPITISGKVMSEDGSPLNERKVGVLSNGNLLTEAETGIAGLFEIQATFSPQTPTVPQNLTIAVEPKDVYAGTLQEKTLNIVKIATRIDVSVPSFVILPAGIYVDGSVNSVSGPLQGATVTLELMTSSVVVKTAKDGRFNATLNMPLNTLFAGSQELRATAEPAEPWQAQAQTVTGIFIMNPVNVGLASAAFVSLGAVFFVRGGRFKNRRGGKQAEIPTAPSPQEKRGVTALPTKLEIKLKGAKGKILEEYVKALRIVERVTEISLKPQMTLHEFLREAEPKLGGAVSFFGDLTGLAERTLYSPYAPETKDGGRAEDLATIIERVLKGGSA